MTSISTGPHYEILSTELAAWIEQQGDDVYWTADGDLVLPGLVRFPCPGDELAPAFRKLNRPLLVRAREGDLEAKGQVIDRSRLDGLVELFFASVYRPIQPPAIDNRCFYVCWKGSTREWLLIEDVQSTEDNRQDMADLQKEVK